MRGRPRLRTRRASRAGGSQRSRSSTSARGSVSIFIVGLSVALVGIAGIGVDGWRVLSTRRALAAVADAMATAGADGLDPNSLRVGGVALDPALARRLSAEEFARQRGLVHAPSAAISADRRHVVVVLRETVPLSLLSVLTGHADVVIEVHAAAAPLRSP
jgi:hypothetical protein